MTSEDVRRKLGAMLIELRNLRQREAEVIDEFLNFLGRPPQEKTPEVYDGLPWEQRQGKKGPFEMVSERSTNNSDLYQHLFSIVKVNTVDVGKFAHGIGSFYYWVGQNAIFRRPKKKKGANP